MKRILILLAGAAAIAALAIFLIFREPPAHGSAGLHAPAASKPAVAVSERTPRKGTVAPKAKTRVPAPQAKKPAGPASDQDRLQFARDVDTLVALLEQKKPRDNKERHALHDERSKARRKVADALRAHPDLAAGLLQRANAVDAERVARSLARLLHVSNETSLVEALQEQARKGSRPRDRSTALLALETRETSVWLPLTEKAYRSDTSPDVRSEAAGILGRSLADWGRPQSHAEVRALLYGSLASTNAAERIRALRALLNDRNAPPADLAKIEDLSKNDPDAAVRFEAGRTLRVLRTLQRHHD